jgi:hypothetical protein
VLDNVVASELDWILTSHPDMVINKDKIESAMSHHDMITWGLNLKKQIMPSNVIKGLRSYTRVNKSNFAKDLAAQPWKTPAKGTTEEMATQFNKLQMEVVNKHAPAMDQKLKRKQTLKPSAALKNLRRMRDNARSKGQKEKLRAPRRECQMMSRQEGHTHIRDRLKMESGEAWKIVKEIHFLVVTTRPLTKSKMKGKHWAPWKHQTSFIHFLCPRLKRSGKA